MDSKLNNAIYFKELGVFKQSILLLKKYIKKNPSKIEAYGHLIHAYTLNNQIKEAYQYLKKAEKLEKNNSNILSYKARLLLKEGKLEEAFNTIQFAFNRDKNSGFVLLTFSNVLSAMGAIDKAKEALNLAIRVDPKLAEAYALRAIYHNKEGDRKNAIEDAKKALILKPHLKVLDSITEANNLFEAISILKEIIPQIPTNKNLILLNKLAEYQYKVHDRDSAVDTYSQILTRVPNSVEAHIKLATILTEKAEYDKAIEHFNIAKSYNKNNYQIYNNLALCYKQTGDFISAEKNFKKAINLKPKDYHIYLNLALLMMDDNRVFEAIKLIEEALKISPSKIEILNILGTSYLMVYKTNKAFEIANKALNIDPNSPKIYQLLGEIYIRKGELDKALDSLCHSLELYLKNLKNTKIILPPSSAKYMDTKNAKLALKKLYKIFTEKNMKIFLSSGTLLGIVRDGDILPYDKDLDLGLDWKVSRDLVKKTLEEIGFKISKRTQEDDKWLITGVDRKNGVTVDIFFYKKLKDKIVYGFNGKPYPILWEFPHFELSTIEYNGDKWFIPSPYEVYCETMYGENWKTPISNFDTIISSSNLAKESKKLSICFGIGSLIDNIKRSNYKKAKGYCLQLIPIYNKPIIHKVLEHMEFILDSYEKTKKEHC